MQVGLSVAQGWIRRRNLLADLPPCHCTAQYTNPATLSNRCVRGAMTTIANVFIYKKKNRKTGKRKEVQIMSG